MMLALLLLAIPLAMFLLKPVWFRPSTEQVSQSEENLRLYQERTQELADSDLPEDEKNTLQLELDREFLASAEGTSQALKAGSKRERAALSADDRRRFRQPGIDGLPRRIISLSLAIAQRRSRPARRVRRACQDRCATSLPR